jgi:N-acyl-D-aspartate/D-glutamate deacylase
MAADLVIRGGTVVDGTGAPGYRADVAVHDGRIVEIGEGLEGARVLEADGHVVAPGFIDIHTHYDAQVFWDPALTPSSWHGVTSVVAGNCGFTIAPCRPEHRELIGRTLQHVEDMNLATLQAGIPWDFETFPEYLDSVARHGSALNFGAYVGHTALRLFVMGDEGYEREATEEELDAMAAVVREALLAGAVGFATTSAPTHNGEGGRPVPSRLADIHEMEALVTPLRELGRGVGAFTPGERVKHPEVYALQKRIGRPFTWTALLTRRGTTFAQDMAAFTAEQQADGAEVYPQVTCRPLTFQMNLRDPFTFNTRAMWAALMDRPMEERVAAYRDPEWRRRATEELAAGTFMPNWATTPATRRSTGAPSPRSPPSGGSLPSTRCSTSPSPTTSSPASATPSPTTTRP